MSELINAPEVLQLFYEKIQGMDHMIGQAKSNRMRAFVNKAYRTNKMDQINLEELAQLSVKGLSAATRNL